MQCSENAAAVHSKQKCSAAEIMRHYATGLIAMR